MISLDFSDNGISDHGMSAIKYIIKLGLFENLNLVSNMISAEGLEILCDTLSLSHSVRKLDFGVSKGSMRKNSMENRGALSLATIIYENGHETIKKPYESRKIYRFLAALGHGPSLIEVGK